jgi:hypothetical protein
MLQKALALSFLFLFSLALDGCVSDGQERSEERLVFEGMMNRSVGQVTYEQVLGFFGPPSERTETATSITGFWEDPTSNGFRMDRSDGGTGGLTRLRGERVRMVFDRRTQLLKSWDYPGR